MGLLSATIAERISVKIAMHWLLPLTTAGVLSVFYWYWTEAQGHGDLRPYLFVQFGSLVAVVGMLIHFRPRRTRTSYLIVALASYAVGKLMEAFDVEIYSFGGFVSGHTLKHLAAASGAYFVLRMIRAGFIVLATGFRESLRPHGRRPAWS